MSTNLSNVQEIRALMGALGMSQGEVVETWQGSDGRTISRALLSMMLSEEQREKDCAEILAYLRESFRKRMGHDFAGGQ
jgi:hypothetical protein